MLKNMLIKCLFNDFMKVKEHISVGRWWEQQPSIFFVTKLLIFFVTLEKLAHMFLRCDTVLKYLLNRKRNVLYKSYVSQSEISHRCIGKIRYLYISVLQQFVRALSLQKLHQLFLFLFNPLTPGAQKKVTHT